MFGGPDWKTLVAPEVAERCRKEGTIPVLRDAHRTRSSATSSMSTTSSTRSSPRSTIRRPRQLYNIAMDEPVDYAADAAHLKATQGLGSIDIPERLSFQLADNTRAKFDLNWRPRYDLASSSTPPGLSSARPRSPEGLVSGLTGDVLGGKAIRLDLVAANVLRLAHC